MGRSGSLVLFSIVHGAVRQGRPGGVRGCQRDLNKWAQQLAYRSRTVAWSPYNWGPWAGGMVTTAQTALRERRTVLIPPADGARLVVDFCDESDGPVEIVVLAEHQTVDGTPASRNPAFAGGPRTETVFRRPVDVESMPVLSSHVIDGHPVLPDGAHHGMAGRGGAPSKPGTAGRGLDNVRVFKGLILKDQPAGEVDVRVGKAIRSRRRLLCRSSCEALFPTAARSRHARADVVLVDRHATGVRRLPKSASVPDQTG